MSTGFNVIGDSSIIGNLSIDTVSPNDNTHSVIDFNSMTTTERGLFAFTGPTLVYDSTLAQWFLYATAGVGVPIGTVTLAPNLGIAAGTAVAANDSRIAALSSVPQSTFIARRGLVGTGPAQQVTAGSQFLFSGSTVDLVQPLNRFNNMVSVLNYQLWNDATSANSSSLAETIIKFATITASTFLIDADGVQGQFAGTFVVDVATTSTIRVYVNNVLICERVISTSPSGAWIARFNVMRYQVNGIRCSAEIISDVGGGLSSSDAGFANVIFNAVAAFDIQLRVVNSVGTNNINCSLVNMTGGKNT